MVLKLALASATSLAVMLSAPGWLAVQWESRLLGRAVAGLRWLVVFMSSSSVSVCSSSVGEGIHEGNMILQGAGTGTEFGSQTLTILALRSATSASGMASWCLLVAVFALEGLHATGMLLHLWALPAPLAADSFANSLQLFPNLVCRWPPLCWIYFAAVLPIL